MNHAMTASRMMTTIAHTAPLPDPELLVGV